MRVGDCRSRAGVCQAGRALVFGACAPGRLAALDRPILCGPSRKSFLKVGDRRQAPSSETGAQPRPLRPACSSAPISSGSMPCRRWRTSSESRTGSEARPAHPPKRSDRRVAGCAGCWRPTAGPAVQISYAGMVQFLGSILRRPPVGWWDLLDIAIVSVLIYEFLKLIRGTRAVQMAVGSLLSSALFYISRLAPLQTVNWMIRNMLVYWRSRRSSFSSRTSGARSRISARRRSSATSTARKRPTRRSKRSSSRRRCWRRSGSGRSSRSSGRSGCATTSRAASRSTRR